MPQGRSPKELPSFVRLNTLRDMSKIALRIAVAKKAIAEIRKIRMLLATGRADVDDVELAAKELAFYGDTIADKAAEAGEMVGKLTKKVEGYRRKL